MQGTVESPGDTVEDADTRGRLNTLGAVEAGDTEETPDAANTPVSADTEGTSDTRGPLVIVEVANSVQRRRHCKYFGCSHAVKTLQAL